MKQLLVIAALCLSMLMYGQPMTPVQIAEKNKPATVMIQATFKGTVSAIEPTIDVPAVQTLAQEIRTQLEAEGRFTNDLFWNTYLLTYCKDIEKYMMKGTKTVTKKLNTTMMGSGFIVTPDGYIITNAHVVDENDETTKQNFAQQAFEELLKDDAASIEKTMGRKLTGEEAKALTGANSWYFSQTIKVGEIEKEFTVVFGVTGPKGKIIPKVIPAKVIIKGSAIPGKDVAILKLAGNHIYPTLRLGDDREMRVGDQVYVLGYPGVATFHPLLSDETVSEASLTRGLVSAKKNMKDGWEVLQIDAAVTHGNSGGPVMNEYGEVIGLATFGSIDFQRQSEVQGMNFIVPSTIVKEFIRKAKVKPAMSDISLTYEEGLDFFHASRYVKALEKFDDVKAMNKSFPFVDQMIRTTERNIDRGLDKEPQDMTMYYYIGGGAVLLILLLFLIFRKRKKKV